MRSVARAVTKLRSVVRAADADQDLERRRLEVRQRSSRARRRREDRRRRAWTASRRTTEARIAPARPRGPRRRRARRRRRRLRGVAAARRDRAGGRASPARSTFPGAVSVSEMSRTRPAADAVGDIVAGAGGGRRRAVIGGANRRKIPLSEKLRSWHLAVGARRAFRREGSDAPRYWYGVAQTLIKTDTTRPFGRKLSQAIHPVFIPSKRARPRVLSSSSLVVRASSSSPRPRKKNQNRARAAPRRTIQRAHRRLSAASLITSQLVERDRRVVVHPPDRLPEQIPHG